MKVMDDLRSRWFVTSLSVAAALFFTGALILSALAYVSVMDARKNIKLASAVETAELLSNGSLLISLTIELENPSREALQISMVSWAVRVHNATDSGVWWIPVASGYADSPEDAVVNSHETKLYQFSEVISDSELLSELRGYVNYSVSMGTEHTLETIPYYHDFRFVAWLGDYEHDYLYYKEMYLNDMVKIERRYYGGVYT